jgi:hypothetical protein
MSDAVGLTVQGIWGRDNDRVGQVGGGRGSGRNSILRPRGGTGDIDHERWDEPYDEVRGRSGATGAVKILPTTDDELRCAINVRQRRRATECRAMSVRYD